MFQNRLISRLWRGWSMMIVKLNIRLSLVPVLRICAAVRLSPPSPRTVYVRSGTPLLLSWLSTYWKMDGRMMTVKTD